MFDGSTLEGWKANEHPESWTVKDGAIRGDGPASHLFYMTEKCVNCEFKAEVRINHGGNSGMYFRTAFGPGFPKGYEAQVDSTPDRSGRNGQPVWFGQGVRQLIPDDTWWTQHIIVEGNHIQIFVNDKPTVDFIDENNTYTSGYLALQEHNPGSVVEYKNLMMKALSRPQVSSFGNLAYQGREQSTSSGRRAAHRPGDADSRRTQRNSLGIVASRSRQETIGVNASPALTGWIIASTGCPGLRPHVVRRLTTHRMHEALKNAKIRKKTDEHYYFVDSSGADLKKWASAYVHAFADGTTLRREGNDQAR